MTTKSDLERAEEITNKMVEGGTEANEWSIYDKVYLTQLVAAALKEERRRLVERVRRTFGTEWTQQEMEKLDAMDQQSARMSNVLRKEVLAALESDGK